MAKYKDFGSENWQLFFQSGRYFIRNRDYGAGWQLGFDTGRETSPKLYPRNAGVTQQWTVEEVLGGWKVKNGAVQNMVVALRGDKTPVMQRKDNTDGEVWNVNRRDTSEDESRPITEDMLRQMDGMDVASTSTSSASSSASASASSALSGPSAHQTLSSGAKAGMAIGVLAFVAIVAFCLWFILLRRKRSLHSVRKIGAASIYESDSHARNELPAWPTLSQSARNDEVRDGPNSDLVTFNGRR